MSSALNDSPSLPRSYSLPCITRLGSLEVELSATHQQDDVPQSESYSAISCPAGPDKADGDKTPALTADVARPPEPQRVHTEGSQEKATHRLVKEERPKLSRVGRRKSLVARPKSWIQSLKNGSPERRTDAENVVSTPFDAPPVPVISQSTRDRNSKTRTVSASFAPFSRKSWMASSRSPSPNRNVLRETENGAKSSIGSTSTGSPTKTFDQSANAAPRLDQSLSATTSDSPPRLRHVSTFQKIKQRPTSVLLNLTTFNSSNSSTSSLPRSSFDNRSTPRTSMDKVPPLPKNLSTDKLPHSGTENSTRKRDELWSAFRSLENSLSKFQSKSWSLKTNVVRSSLLPFLRNHASHPSNKSLRPEDLDRRVTVLNKWWTEILEVLDGRQNQTVSSVDRPVLLEACHELMTRPEWRLSPSQYAPLADRSPDQTSERPGKNLSSVSLSSSASQFITESVYHKTRNLYIQNLLAQMTFVVEKMSLRHAPASLVTFCGKAAAYAFFFVPGIADMLVRIWNLEAVILRRVSDALGMPRRIDKTETDRINAAFPRHMQALGWTSVKTMVGLLRHDPALPVLITKISWLGPWAARWCGRDSDLFFVFVKHYHILVEEFLPSDLTLAEKARTPGFMLVQAQVLRTLDATIHRQPAADPLPITFDDVLAGADANAAALPLPSNNSARLMAENRLIMLLRDFIPERYSDYDAARKTFAGAFSKMMNASAARTSLFDHNACFVLLDFAEEALSIYVRFSYAQNLEWDFIDWPFWLTVCQKMLESENSMSEIRLVAFLYGSWQLITADESRKRILCLEWLLLEETFDRFFNHWCPMVRAYFMRLLCWRLCRNDGEASDLDTKIFSTLSIRLKSNWAYYSFLKQRAERAHTLPPSIIPCHPAPGRRLLIIRNDSQISAPGQFLGFDGTANPSSSEATQAVAPKKQSLSVLTKSEPVDPATKSLSDSPPTAPNRKRWTFLGKNLPTPFTTTAETNSSEIHSTSPTNTLEDVRLHTEISCSRPVQDVKSPSSDSDTPPSTSTHRVFSFKFSLEWSQHFEMPTNGSPQQGPGMPSNTFHAGVERRIVSPRLPAPAQAWIGARVPGMSQEIAPRDPTLDGTVGGDRVRRAKYAGRALAEWAIVVGECNNFVERRKSEGVPGLKWMEIPSLGVEGFRRFG